MESLDHLEVLFLQNFRVDYSGLVADEFGTPLEVLGELRLHEVLEVFVVAQVDRVPKLGLAEVQVVDAVEILVLLVPAKHALPLASIDIRRVDSLDLLVAETLVKDGVQLCQIPRDVLVKQRPEDISSIQRSIVD